MSYPRDKNPKKRKRRAKKPRETRPELVRLRNMEMPLFALPPRVWKDFRTVLRFGEVAVTERGERLQILGPEEPNGSYKVDCEFWQTPAMN